MCTGRPRHGKQGIRLTEWGNPTKVEEGQMVGVSQSGGGLRQLRMRNWLCLLLAITFLYNPFLGVSSSFLGQSVNHLPSFRETVASSELLKFKPQESQQIVEAVTIAEVALPLLASLLLPQPSPFALRDDSSEPVPTQYFSIGNLWFRPPPAVG